jgi:hypothetical protein
MLCCVGGGRWVLDEIAVVFTSLSYVQMDNVQGVVSEILMYNVLVRTCT